VHFEAGDVFCKMKRRTAIVEKWLRTFSTRFAKHHKQHTVDAGKLQIVERQNDWSEQLEKVIRIPRRSAAE
jgi:hypothetical protein